MFERWLRDANIIECRTGLSPGFSELPQTLSHRCLLAHFSFETKDAPPLVLQGFIDVLGLSEDEWLH
jgi:hypothetical protein